MTGRAGTGRGIDVLLLLVAAVWGSTYLAAKGIVTPGTVVAVLALRFALTAVAMVPFSLRSRAPRPRGETAAGVLLGLVLATILTFETYGIAHTSATNAGLIISLTIVMTPLLESVVGRSWLPRAFFAATAVTVLGVALLASGSGDGFSAPALGDWLVLVAAAVRAVHVVLMHRRTAGRAYDSGRLTHVQMTTAAGVFVLASLAVGEPPTVVAASFGAAQWAALVYLALVGTVFAFAVQMWAVRRTSGSRVSLLLGTEPLWALVVGLALGGDRLGPAGVVGAVLVVVGTAWGQGVEQRHRAAGGGRIGRCAPDGETVRSSARSRRVLRS
ncbi:DMT family transporter [Actinotalea ferrariae]|uniref:DMT family transporter n=1 Tax=Actinotalea ferrariae TaxID=1386098 RepID=UPI0009DD634A|nr:DMT family transporter [Actinotalea ferrariae]